jgi:hypothetical protein
MKSADFLRVMKSQSFSAVCTLRPLVGVPQWACICNLAVTSVIKLIAVSNIPRIDHVHWIYVRHTL